MRYGIFGLTADPMHYAHYEIVNKVLKDSLVDKVIVIPTIVDYYRKDKERMFTNEQRLQIIQKWFENREDVIVDDSEYKFASAIEGCIKYDVVPDEDIERKRISERRYWHTLKSVLDRYQEVELNNFYTIIGGDSWNNLESWYKFEELGKMTNFIVVRRNEHMIKDFAESYPEYVHEPHSVIHIDEKFANISATEIRKHLHEACDGMGLGPNGIALNVWLEEIEDYKENGKTYMDRDNEYDNAIKAIKPFYNVKDCEIKDVKDCEDFIAHTPIFDLIKGKEVEKGFRPVKIKSKDWVSIIVEKDGKFLMEKQLRHGLNKEFEEFPCGMIEDGEKPVVAALRELEEETGMKINTYDLSYLGKFAANPAFMTNYMHYFYVKPTSYEEVDTKFDEHEHLTSYWVDKKKAFENFIRSEGSSIMGCAWMLLIKDRIVDEFGV